MRSSPLCWALGLIASAAQASAGSSFSSSSSSGAVVAEPRGIPNVHTARQAAAAAAAAPAYWYSQVLHNGASPTIANGNNWTVFRNVRDFGAKGDGVADDSAAINRAILLGNAQGDRASGVFGITQQPAVVYFPSGTYLVNRAVQNLVDTVLMGDPTDRPLIKAGPLFNETTLLVGRDPKVAGLGAFQFEIKNLVLDSTALATRSAFNLLVRPQTILFLFLFFFSFPNIFPLEDWFVLTKIVELGCISGLPAVQRPFQHACWVQPRWHHCTDDCFTFDDQRLSVALFMTDRTPPRPLPLPRPSLGGTCLRRHGLQAPRQVVLTLASAIHWRRNRLQRDGDSVPFQKYPVPEHCYGPQAHQHELGDRPGPAV